MKSFILSSLVAIASAQTVAFAETLKCGACIVNNYNFCLKGTDGQMFNSTVKPTTKCCKDATCLEAKDPTYICSKTYSDMDYALTMCPQMDTQCGKNVTFEFQTESMANVTAKNLTFGDSCTYKVKSTCGSPAFQLQKGRNLGVNITFIEFDGSGVNRTTPGKTNNTSPNTGMPSRN
jgi:hypothetical protein